MTAASKFVDLGADSLDTGAQPRAPPPRGAAGDARRPRGREPRIKPCAAFLPRPRRAAPPRCAALPPPSGARAAVLSGCARFGRLSARVGPRSRLCRASRAGASGASVADRLKAFFGGAKLDRNKLAALGTSALLAYGAQCARQCPALALPCVHAAHPRRPPLSCAGFVSNVNAITLVIISWVSFTKSTGLSPLAAGQWKAYLLTYAALYAVVGNGLRPIRFSISVAITPVFDRFVAFLQKRFNVAKPVAFGMCVFLVNVCGTCTYAALGLRIVTAVLGLPFLA